MNAPKVTIFCVTYNQDKYIRQCLESFLNQKTNFEFEVLIADDCSTDLTPQIIKEYAQKYPKIIKPIFRDKNIGPGQNFVYGLQKVTGKYIAYCEGDDFFEDENKIQLQADFLDLNQEYSFCFHPVRVFFENKEEPDYIFPSNGKSKKYTLERLLKSNFIQSNAVMYRKMDYSNIPTNITPGDWYLHLYHAAFGDIGFIDKTMSAYRRHQEGIWWQSYIDQKTLIEKNNVSMIMMYLELLRLFGGNDTYKQIILKNIRPLLLQMDILNTEIFVKKENYSIFHSSINFFSKIFFKKKIICKY